MRILIVGCAAIGLAAALMGRGVEVVDHDLAAYQGIELHQEVMFVAPCAVADQTEAQIVASQIKTYPPWRIAKPEDRPRDIEHRSLEVAVWTVDTGI